MANKILAIVEYVGRDSADPEEMLVAQVIWFASGNYSGLPQNGQEQIHFAVDQSEAQITNDIRTALVAIINPLLGTSFNAADVRGCNI